MPGAVKRSGLPLLQNARGVFADAEEKHLEIRMRALEFAVGLPAAGGPATPSS